MSLSLPEFTSGNLLSAYHLNTLTDAVNTIKGAIAAPPATFVKTGSSATYYARRRYQYVHVRYSVTRNSGTVTVTIGADSFNHVASASDEWQTFNLSAKFGSPAVGEWYSITTSRSGDGTYFVEEIRESSADAPDGTGTYTTPPTFNTADSAATFLTNLQTLRTSILSFAETITAPGSTFLRTDDDRHYTMQRRQDSIAVTYTSYNAISMDVYLASAAGSQKLFDDGTARDQYTRTFTYASLTYPPDVGEHFTLRWERNAGNLLVDDITESGWSFSTYAPSWSHGYATSNASAMVALLNQYSTTIAECYTRLGVVGWQYPCIWRPADPPRWGIHKHKRYLHYMRDGGNPCYLSDPGGDYDDVSLPRTTNEPNAIGVYDLDSIDWLTPGGLAWIHNADFIWLDDEA